MKQSEQMNQSQFENFEQYNEFLHELFLVKNFVPNDILKEIEIVKDLFEVSYNKNNLYLIADLHLLIVLEKSLRIRLYEEYKTIIKIKFSVLIDKSFQMNIINEEQMKFLRQLKDLRNLQIHQRLDNQISEMPLYNAILMMKIIRLIFNVNEMYFLKSYKTGNYDYYAFSEAHIYKIYNKLSEEMIEEAGGFDIVKESNISELL